MSDLCRREGIKPHSYYLWTKEFTEAGKERLARETVRDATQQEVQALRRENLELKQLMAELSLEGHMRRLEPGGGLQTYPGIHQEMGGLYPPQPLDSYSPPAASKSTAHENRTLLC